MGAGRGGVSAGRGESEWRKGMDGYDEGWDLRGGQAAGERERGGDGARAGRLALRSLMGASTELDIYLLYYLY